MFNKGFVILCFIFALVASSPEWKEWIESPIKDACAKELDVNIESLRENMKNHNFDKDTLCFSKCVMEKMELLKDGLFNKERLTEFPMLRDKLQNKSSDQALECIDSVGKIETCEDIKKFHECLND